MCMSLCGAFVGGLLGSWGDVSPLGEWWDVPKVRRSAYGRTVRIREVRSGVSSAKGGGGGDEGCGGVMPVEGDDEDEGSG